MLLFQDLGVLLRAANNIPPSGLVAYAYEIVARTEQYFCPIKHARRILGTHSRYPRFLDYGDAADYEAWLEVFRVALARMK